MRHPESDPKQDPKKITFELALGHEPLNKLLNAKYTLEELAEGDSGLSQDAAFAICERQKLAFLEYWPGQDLDQCVSAGRVDRAFTEEVAKEMAAGDWTDPKFIESMIRKLDAIKETGWSDSI